MHGLCRKKVFFYFFAVIAFVWLVVCCLPTKEATATKEAISTSNSAAEMLLQSLAIDVKPTTIIPDHKMVLLNPLTQDCFFGEGDNSYCAQSSKGVADPHVAQVIMTTLQNNCLGSLRKRKLTYDIGSNVGQFSLFMRAMGCKVIAFEPQKAMNWFSKASFIVNGWLRDESIRLHEVGISDSR